VPPPEFRTSGLQAWWWGCGGLIFTGLSRTHVGPTRATFTFGPSRAVARTKNTFMIFFLSICRKVDSFSFFF
jgi:hypothetical protein